MKKKNLRRFCEKCSNELLLKDEKRTIYPKENYHKKNMPVVILRWYCPLCDTRKIKLGLLRRQRVPFRFESEEMDAFEVYEFLRKRSELK